MSSVTASEQHADQKLLVNLGLLLVRPRSTLRMLVRDSSARPGAAAIAVLALAWSGLLFALWQGGHAPSFTLLPIAGDNYYAVQAVLMMPLLTGLWWVHSTLAHRMCLRAGGSGAASGVRTALGFAYAAPMLFTHVLPELIAYAFGGFALMAQVGRVSLGLASLWVWALSAGALRVAHGVSAPVAIGASFVGLLVQALLGSPFIR